MTSINKEELPLREIPEAPSEVNAANVLARTVEGLGYRFYWATEGLTDKELDFDPGNDNRSPREMMSHFVGLSRMILNAVNHEANIRPAPAEELEFTEQRAIVLGNLKKASDRLRSMNDNELEQCKVIFKTGDKTREFPLWNLINGPLSDALYHTGQIVSQRRSAGNPIPKGVNVFIGKTKE